MGLLLLACAATAGQTVPPAVTPAIIEGQVIHAATGEPVRKAHVTLELSKVAHDSEFVALTDETGHFRFADVEPGV